MFSEIDDKKSSAREQKFIFSNEIKILVLRNTIAEINN